MIDPSEVTWTPNIEIDMRAGIVAVRDTQHPRFDPEHHGLHGDEPDVVWYELGVEEKQACPTCGHTKSAGWCLREGVDERASKASKKYMREVAEAQAKRTDSPQS